MGCGGLVVVTLAVCPRGQWFNSHHPECVHSLPFLSSPVCLGGFLQVLLVSSSSPKTCCILIGSKLSSFPTTGWMVVRSITLSPYNPNDFGTKSSVLMRMNHIQATLDNLLFMDIHRVHSGSFNVGSLVHSCVV